MCRRDGPANTIRLIGFHGPLRPALLVVAALLGHIFGTGDVELIGHYAVTPGNFVEPGTAVAHPLASDENRHLGVESEHHLLEG